MSRRRLRGRVLVRLGSGRALGHVAAHRDVQLGVAQPATSIDGGGKVDQALRRGSSRFLATRSFHARATLGVPGHGHEGWDDVEHRLGLSRTFHVRVDSSASVDHVVAALNALDEVEMATPHYLCETPFDYLSRAASVSTPAAKDTATTTRDTRDPWARIGAARALEIEPGDSTLIVALIDSGVDGQHPELTGRLRPGLSTVDLDGAIDHDIHLVAPGHQRGQDISDDEGHGTVCAGILRARGLHVPPGLGGLATLLPMRALCGALLPHRDRPTAIGSLPDIDAALKAAVDLGARIINLSFGTPESELDKDDPVPHVEVVRYALARGCVLVAASGNSGGVMRFYPAALPGVIAVGAIDDDGVPAPFTTRGDHVALCAPGEQLTGATVGGYGSFSGTSFASPLVAGACALLLARAARHSASLDAMALRRLLMSSASPFAGGADGNGCGAGILDIPAALRATDEQSRMLFDEPAMGLLAGTKQGEHPWQ